MDTCRACMHACIPMHVCVRVCVRCMRMHACVRMHVHACVRMHVHACVRMHVHACACMCMHAHACACMYLPRGQPVHGLVESSLDNRPQPSGARLGGVCPLCYRADGAVGEVQCDTVGLEESRVPGEVCK